MKRLCTSIALTLGCLQAVSAGQILPHSTPPLCGAEVPSSLFPIQSTITQKYGKIECRFGDPGGDWGNIINNKATIGLASRNPKGDQIIVVHEMMHLWLGTQGWNESETRIYKFRAKAQPELGQSFVDRVGSMLEDYIQHRMFVPLMHSAGLSEEAEQKISLKKYEGALLAGQSYSAALDGVFYRMMNLASPTVAIEYADFLKRNGGQSALDAAAIYDSVIEKENPRNQMSAYKAAQDCLDKVFYPGSSYLKLTNPSSNPSVKAK